MLPFGSIYVMQHPTVEATLQAQHNGRALPSESALTTSYWGNSKTTSGRGLRGGTRRPVDHPGDGFLAASSVFRGDPLAVWWGRAKRRPARYYPHYLDIANRIASQFVPGGDICCHTASFSLEEDSGSMVTAEDEGRKHSPSALKACCQIWRGLEGEAYHPVGCGDKVVCPMCADYYHATMSREAIEFITQSIARLRARGLELVQYRMGDDGELRPITSYGDQTVVTLPKAASVMLEGLRLSDPYDFIDKIGKLRRAAFECVKAGINVASLALGWKPIGQIGCVNGMHDRGSKVPWEAHYHWHNFTSPYTADYDGSLGLDNWRMVPVWWQKGEVQYKSMPQWWRSWYRKSEGLGKNVKITTVEVDPLEFLRLAWQVAAERILKVKYPGKWNVYRQYIGVAEPVDKYGQKQLPDANLVKAIFYQLRPPMRDLWIGTTGDGDGFRYVRRNEKGEVTVDMPMAEGDFYKAAERARTLFRRDYGPRVSWFGLWAKHRTKNTLKNLALSALTTREDDAGKRGGVNPDYWRAVGSDAEGVFMRCARLGDAAYDSRVVKVPWADLRQSPVSVKGEKPIGCKYRRTYVPSGQFCGSVVNDPRARDGPGASESKAKSNSRR